MFPSFVQNPKNSRYEGQDPDEHIMLLLRAHPITNLSWIIPAILIFLLPWYLPYFLALMPTGLNFPIPQNLSLVFLIINYLLVLVIVFEGFLSWYFNVYLLTSKKIVDIDFHSILSKNIDFALLEDVQEANSALGGVLGMFFNYGDVFVQTAAAKQSIDFYKVPHPDKVADIIMDHALKVREGKK